MKAIIFLLTALTLSGVVGGVGWRIVSSPSDNQTAPTMVAGVQNNDTQDSPAVAEMYSVRERMPTDSTPIRTHRNPPATLDINARPIAVPNEPRVRVDAGPPAFITIDMDKNGSDAGGGMWQISVSARVTDADHNPVADGITVDFRVLDPSKAYIEPAQTGNTSGYGAAQPGIAFTNLHYNSSNTFDTTQIYAKVGKGLGSISCYQPITLPLQQGRLELRSDPQNHMFPRTNLTDSCFIRIWAILKDGHGVEINNAPILFRSDRQVLSYRDYSQGGQFKRYNSPPDFLPCRRFTGSDAIRWPNSGQHEVRGVSTVYLFGQATDFFLEDLTQEVTVHIEASVEGYDVASDPVFVFMTRRAGAK